MGWVGLWRHGSASKKNVCEHAIVWFKIVSECKEDLFLEALGEINPFHSISLSQCHSSRSEKKAKEVCWLLRSWTERGNHRAVLRSRARRCCKNQGFTWPVYSSLASSAKLGIVKVAKTWILDKLGDISLVNWNEPQAKIMETRWDNCTANYTHQVFFERAFWTNSRPTMRWFELQN